jgi:signal peptidase II
MQVGGALGNLLDRVALGGATDIIYAGWGPVWNLADVALAVGTVLATWALARRRHAVNTVP